MADTQFKKCEKCGKEISALTWRRSDEGKVVCKECSMENERVPGFQCQECGKKFYTTPPEDCPKCGGSDIDVCVENASPLTLRERRNAAAKEGEKRYGSEKVENSFVDKLFDEYYDKYGDDDPTDWTPQVITIWLEDKGYGSSDIRTALKEFERKLSGTQGYGSPEVKNAKKCEICSKSSGTIRHYPESEYYGIAMDAHPECRHKAKTEYDKQMDSL